MAQRELQWWEVPLVLVILVGLFYAYLKWAPNESPELVLVGALVFGVIVLILVLTFATFIFSALGLSNPIHSLGLPEGSIRAVIALSLILIFMISSVFLYYYVAGPIVFRSSNITENQIMALPNGSIVEIDRVYSVNNTTLYNVSVTRERTKASEDLAKQLVTTVSTLAVAVAGFYFGTKAVSVASQAVAPQSDPVIRGMKPDNGLHGKEIEFIITGKNFDSPDVRLIQGTTLIKDPDITEVTSNPTTIKGLLKVPGDSQAYPAGAYTLVVINSDKAEDRMENAFTIKKKEEKEPVSPPPGQKDKDITGSG